MKKMVVVRFREEGWHRWPEAPIERVYLRNRHRHLFHVEVKVAVEDGDREIEFHDLLDFAREKWAGFGKELQQFSCEHLAQLLILGLMEKWPARVMSVGVFEDGEVGAEVWLTEEEDI